jgi:peptide/nickel transport system permease protein
VQPPTPSWGNLIQEGQGYLRDSIWVSLFPGMTLFVAVLSLNLVGDGLRDLLDARGRTRTG